MKKLLLVQEVLELACYTSFVEGIKPVSVLLCSASENGKTSMMGKFKQNEGVYWLSDATAFGIISGLFDSKKYVHTHHMVISDLNIPLQRDLNTANMFMGLLMSLCYEGVQEIQTYHIKLALKEPVTIGVLAGITPDVLKRKRKAWLETGAIRRFLPLSYDFTGNMVSKIFEDIQHKKSSLNGHVSLDEWHGLKVHITLPPEMAKQFESTARKLAHEVSTLDAGSATPLKGFTYQEQLQSLAMAHAVRRKSLTVEQQDIDGVLMCSPFINYKCKSINSIDEEAD